MSIKRYDGTSWVDNLAKKRFDGANWVDAASVKRFDGLNWIETARNQSTLNDLIDVRYLYEAYFYTYQTYTVRCTKCGKYILQVMKEVESNKCTSYYWNDDQTTGGVTEIDYNKFYALFISVNSLAGGSGQWLQSTKATFKIGFDKNAIPYSYYDNWRYATDGRTRNLFTSGGVLICPWCE